VPNGRSTRLDEIRRADLKLVQDALLLRRQLSKTTIDGAFSALSELLRDAMDIELVDLRSDGVGCTRFYRVRSARSERTATQGRRRGVPLQVSSAATRYEERSFLMLLVAQRCASRKNKEDTMAEKQAAKLRRRDNREQREREKATRSGDSPAQKAEHARRRDEASADRNVKNRSGGGDAG
jgi:hypothetical protein